MIIAIVLGIIGLLLVYLEFFVPGGVAACIGAFFLLTSVAWFAIASVDLVWSFTYLFAVIAAVIVICRIALWHIRSSAKHHTLYSGKDQQGYAASSYDKNLIGKIGVCISDLKPSGHILIEGKQAQALSETGYLVEHTKVIVIGGKGSHLIVKPLTKENEL